MADDLTPLGIERKMRSLVNELALSQQVLADCRNAEVYAKHTYESTRRALLLGPKAPKVGKGEGQVTVAYRDAWVDYKCQEEQQAYDIAVVRRQAAADHLGTLRDQAVLVTALAKSVAMSMSLAGATG